MAAKVVFQEFKGLAGPLFGFKCFAWVENEKITAGRTMRSEPVMRHKEEGFAGMRAAAAGRRSARYDRPARRSRGNNRRTGPAMP